MLLKENTFTKRKYYRMFVSFLLSWGIIIISEMFDSFAAGIYIDSNAVAAIELITPIQFLIYSIAILFTFGIGVLYNRELGNYNKEKSQQIAGMGLLVSVVGGLICNLMIYTFAEQIIGFYGCSKQIHDYAVIYLRTYSFCIVPNYFFYHLQYMMSADGNDKLVLFVSIVTALLTALLPNVLAPFFGIKGIAISSTIVYTITALLSCLHFLSKRNSISYKLYFSFKDFFELIKISSVYSLTNVFTAVNDLIFNFVIIDVYSDTYLLAYEIINIVFNMGEIMNATMDAGSAFVSMTYSEKNNKSTKSIMKMTLKTNLIFSVVLGTAMFLLAGVWPTLFGIEDPQTIELAIFAGRVMPISYIFIAIVTVLSGYYPCIDKIFEGNLVVFMYSLAAPLIICLPLAYFVGFKAMIVGFIFTPILAIIVLFAYFKINKKDGAPLFLPKSDYNELSYNIVLNEENVVELKDKLIDDLDSYNVNKTLVREIGVVIEDGLLTIKKQNKKKVIAEVTALFNKEEIRLVIKDDGVIFDLIKASNDGKDLTSYVVDRMLSNTYMKENDIVISYNRNSFLWNL